MGNLMSRPLDALDGDDSNPSELERACVLARVAVETAALTGASLNGGMVGLTLAEGDEEGEEGEGEESVSGELGAAAAAVGGCGEPTVMNGVEEEGAAGGQPAGSGGAVHRAGVTQQQRKREELGLAGLMFELEGEGDVAMARCESCELAAPQSPFSQLSIDSVGSGGVGGAGSAGGAAMGALSLLSRNSTAGPATAGAAKDTSMPVARSVYAGTGFMWRGPSKTTSGVRAQSPRRALGARAAYPPPVMAVPPRSTSEVLSGLTDEQWDAFMTQLVCIMDEQLRNGSWSQAAAAPMTVAMSCPRF